MLRILAIILVIVVVLRVLARYLLPVLGRYAIKKASEKMHEKARTRYGKKVFQAGDITIRKSDHSNPNQGNEDIEYIDYEDID